MEKIIPVLIGLVSVVESKFQRIVCVEPAAHCSDPFGERIVRRFPPDGGEGGGIVVVVEGVGVAVTPEEEVTALVGGGGVTDVTELAAAGGDAETIFTSHALALHPSTPET